MQGNGRTYSQEVASGGRGRERGLSMERRNQIAAELQTALTDGQLTEHQTDGAARGVCTRGLPRLSAWLAGRRAVT
jgi:hypothetical protein